MNPNLSLLHPYPFEKLTALKQGLTPPAGLSHIAWSIGEPRHAPPEFVQRTLGSHLDRLGNYPATRGLPELREAIAAWARRRFQLMQLNADSQVLPVNGTREALFAFAQAMIDPSRPALVLSPNPFYQVYEGAALLAGAEPVYLPLLAQNGWLPDLDHVPEHVWRNCQLIYVCSPGNPTGAVVDIATWQRLIALADKYDFVIASDECYSEIYFDESVPPPGLLQAAAAMDRGDYRRCMVFHSLSKRSNLPGLRSGFVAGDATLIDGFLRYRTYHGSAMGVQNQLASIAAWNDESHVIENRRRYRAKFEIVLNELNGVLDVERPDAGFYLWAPTADLGDTQFTAKLFAEQHLSVLPGSFLSREVDGYNPGANRVRMALVATEDECFEGARRLRRFIEGL